MSENFNMESRSVAAGSDVDWEQLYRQGETPWEKGAPHPALVQWLNENPLFGRVLVPGCGFGHDVRVLAAAAGMCCGYCTLCYRGRAGVPSTRSRMARHSWRFLRPGRSGRQIRLDLRAHLFCAIPPDRRGEYAARVARLLNRGGGFVAIFFLNPDHDEEGPPFGCQRDELDALFSTSSSSSTNKTTCQRFRVAKEESSCACC